MGANPETKDTPFTIPEEQVKEYLEQLRNGIVEDVVKQIRNDILKPPQGKEAEFMKAKEKFRDIIKALASGDIGKAKTLSESDEGGVFIPTEVSNQVARLMGEFGLVRKAGARTFPLKNSVRVPVFSGASLSTWGKEDVDYSAVSGSLFSSKTVSLDKLLSLIPITVELIEDAPALTDLLTLLVAEDMAKQEDQGVIFYNSGGGDPWDGLCFNSNVNEYTLSGDVDAEDWTALLTLRDTAPSSVKYTGAYFMHPSVWEHFRADKDNTGRPIFDLEKNTFAGRPVFEADFMPEIGSTSGGKPVVLYGDFRFVWIGEKGNITLEVLTQGTIGDINLITKDYRVLKFRKRQGWQAVMPTAFAVMKTAS